ncbi:MAG: hypothetical protein NWT08_03685 [Akkermansiaceae bacterium]|jgi:hypothetical protein|nr:hypothetical protein [Akkermansiaceae bacterium]MDP4897057.1 hypothetical protein [Akkermansiaceae bacterium]
MAKSIPAFLPSLFYFELIRSSGNSNEEGRKAGKEYMETTAYCSVILSSDLGSDFPDFFFPAPFHWDRNGKQNLRHHWGENRRGI